MAIKKAIIRTEVLYNDEETSPDGVGEDIEEMLKQQSRFNATKAKYQGKTAFLGKEIDKPHWWTATFVYYPYLKK